MEALQLSSDSTMPPRVGPPVMPRPVTGPARDRDAEKRSGRRKKKQRSESETKRPPPEERSRGETVDIRV